MSLPIQEVCTYEPPAITTYRQSPSPAPLPPLPTFGIFLHPSTPPSIKQSISSKQSIKDLRQPSTINQSINQSIPLELQQQEAAAVASSAFVGTKHFNLTSSHLNANPLPIVLPSPCSYRYTLDAVQIHTPRHTRTPASAHTEARTCAHISWSAHTHTHALAHAPRTNPHITPVHAGWHKKRASEAMIKSCPSPAGFGMQPSAVVSTQSPASLCCLLACLLACCIAEAIESLSRFSSALPPPLRPRFLSAAEPFVVIPFPSSSLFVSLFSLLPPLAFSLRFWRFLFF